MQEILKKSNGLAKSYALIKDYTEELFCTGDIHTISYCLEVYRQYFNNKPLDYPIFLSNEIKETLPKAKLHTGLLILKKNKKFYKQIEKLLKNLTPTIYKEFLLKI